MESNNYETGHNGGLKFCPVCGRKLNANEKFCRGCGKDLRRPANGAAGENKQAEFVAGTNTKGQNADQSTNSGTNQNENSHYTAEKNKYAVPNRKEETLEYMIHLSTEMFGANTLTAYRKSRDKFETTYNEARVLYSDDQYFSKIQKFYDECQSRIIAEQSKRNNKFARLIVSRSVLVLISIVLMILAIAVDASYQGYGYSSGAALLAVLVSILMIVAAAKLYGRRAETMEYGITALACVLIICLSFAIRNASYVIVFMVIALVVVAGNLSKHFKREKGQIVD